MEARLSEKDELVASVSHSLQALQSHLGEAQAAAGGVRKVAEQDKVRVNSPSKAALAQRGECLETLDKVLRDSRLQDKESARYSETIEMLVAQLEDADATIARLDGINAGL